MINSPKQETIIPPKEGGSIQLKPGTKIPLAQGQNKSSENKAPTQGESTPPKQEANIPTAEVGNKSIATIAIPPNLGTIIPVAQAGNNQSKQHENKPDQNTIPITSKPIIPQTQDLFPNSNKETTNLSDQITATQSTQPPQVPISFPFRSTLQENSASPITGPNLFQPANSFQFNSSILGPVIHKNTLLTIGQGKSENKSQEANIPAALAGNNQNITLITSKPFLPQTQDLFLNSNKETTNLPDQITAPQRTLQQATPAEKLFCPELLLTDEMEQHQFPKTTEIEGQNALIAKLKTDLNVLQLEFSSIKSENQNLMDCLSKSRESQKEIFNQRLETCNREMASLRENNLNSDAKIGENNRRIQALKGDIVQQNGKFSTRESQLLTEIDSLTKTLSFKEDNLNVAKHTISELNTELEQTQDRYSEVWTGLKSLQTTCDELTMDKNSLHLSVAEMREHIDSTVAEKDTLIDKHSALNKQIMSLKCENGFLINKAISLDKQLSELAEIQEHPSSVQHANYLDALDTSHSCLDEFAPRGAHLHIKALEHLLHLQTLNWSLQEKLNNLTS